MTQEETIYRIFGELEKIYKKYGEEPIIKREGILNGFEDIISDYYEDKVLGR